ncbi:hypothetical protein GP486_002968 [Trichoglossum hirsutum]|uniref:Ankyrin repeat protein n=1 Tax=Trichoglossum hirsutum TaxID=265104 RepID=A0A9P8LE14_9PEZI|nr:hypothetical protein GP486_002968 [Trichoglossum hirsutum]
MTTSRPGQDNPLLDTCPPQVNQKLWHRLYEPLILLSAYGKSQGKHVKSDETSSEGYLDGGNKTLRKKFLDELAYICNYSPSGGTEAAIAIQDGPQLIYRVAANTNQGLKVKPLLSDILQFLGQVYDASEERVSTLKLQISDRTVMFSARRLRCYRTMLRNTIKTCIPMLEKQNTEEANALKEWLISFSNSDLDLISFCRLYYEARDSEFLEVLKQRAKESNIHEDDSYAACGQNSLHVTAQDNDIATLQLLLAEGGNVDSKDDRGWTPLHTAAFSGHTLVIKMLLRHGAAVDAQDNSDRSPLTIAADEGHNDVVEELLRNGANVNLSGRNAWSPLNQALMRNHRDTVKLLLDAGANPTGQDEFGFAPLFIASRHLELVNLLLEAGADPNSDLVGGVTVLHFAARHGNVPLVQRLLAIGMDVDLPEGYTADGYTALYRAVEEQHEEAVRMLLDHGANPDKMLKNSWTSVLYAVKIGHYKILRVMVDRGADLRVTCQPEGWTALHIACREGHRLIVKLLLEAGSEVSARDASGATPLQLATAAGHTSIIEILRKAGGRPGGMGIY